LSFRVEIDLGQEFSLCYTLFYIIIRNKKTKKNHLNDEPRAVFSKYDAELVKNIASKYRKLLNAIGRL